MPELPEVETMCRGIRPIVGATITGVYCPSSELKAIRVSPRLPTFRRHAIDEVIARVERIGKRVLVWLGCEQAIVFEPRMTGLVLLAEPPTAKHLRFCLDLAGSAASHLWYWDRRGLGSVRLLRRGDVDRRLASTRLGPDALALDAERLRERLGHRQRPIKVALLDQAAVAGIGNLYASEILHVAGLDPRVVCQRLTRTQWQRLATSMHQVLEEAIHYEGSTLADGTYRTALSKAGRYQSRHRVYQRAGEPCPTCRGGRVQRIVQAQRATFYCAACQKRR